MMNDLVSEGLITFGEAAKLLPRRRRGRAVSVATIYRWASAGYRGNRLEFLETPSGRLTSAQAVARFFASLTAAQRDIPRQRTPTQRKRCIAEAERELEDAGI